MYQYYNGTDHSLILSWIWRRVFDSVLPYHWPQGVLQRSCTRVHGSCPWAYDRRQAQHADGPQVYPVARCQSAAFSLLPVESRSKDCVCWHETSQGKLLIVRFTRHAQLLENDRLLLIVQDNQGNLFVFLEALAGIDFAIAHNKHKKQLHREKIGQDFILTFDESKKMLALCSSTKACVFSS